LGTAPIEINYYQDGGNKTKELGISKYWILGGLLAVGVIGYFVFKNK
jgi:uncharacterized membrane protein YebE (DUF533 family)